MNSRTHLFINYAVEDGVFVDWLCLRLLREGYSVWCDRLKLLGGESYPNDIDEAISNRAFRFLAVLSKSSIKKPNPLKERTLALQLARARKENFVIPLNLDGLPSTELGWMQSDLTFIQFTNWKSGLTQLLKNLERSEAPKASAPISVSGLLQTKICVERVPETLWSNLVSIRALPQVLYRFEHEMAMNKDAARVALKVWPHYRENATVCWAFEPPPTELLTKYRFSKRGTCQNWREATGPDINFYNLGKKVINAALRHVLLASGLEEHEETGYVFFPNRTDFFRFPFLTPTGSSWIRAVGTRSFWNAGKKIPVRYHLSPILSAWLDFGGRDVVRIRTRLFVTELDDTPVKPAQMQSRRKAICKSWWNYEWLMRVFATLQLISGPDNQIRVGTAAAPIILERFPLAFEADLALNELSLKSKLESQQDTEVMERHYEDSEVLIEEKGEESSPAAEA
ncbi:MAG: toll/interleukin-1 receptor domain-containing protein [Acidobacteriia bacterium]|nr:toll/interleukin-1 receptor domain-containing protein [Terriglobia bacterium]